MTMVKYIKPTSSISVGTIKDMQHQYARALHAMGFVEYYIPEELKDLKREVEHFEIELAEFAKEFKTAEKVEPIKVQAGKIDEEKPKRGRPAKK